MNSILVTWATGYLWSHMRASLLDSWYQVVGVDTCERSSEETVGRVEAVTEKKADFVQGSITDEEMVTQLLRDRHVDTVIHFAAYKAVGESCAEPLLYFDNNISGTISLLAAMHQAWVKQMIFSSSATVYNGAHSAPYSEQSPTGSPTNPYGATKYQIELLLDTYCQHSDLSAVSLRYFNPVGAHPSGKLGEDIRHSNQSLQAFVMKTLLGERDKLAVFGGDRPTADGSCIRDYISVNDLINGHQAALNRLNSQSEQSIQVTNEKINLGTWQGVSVIEFLDLVSQGTGIDLPYEITDRRSGDLGVVYSVADKAKKLLKREATDDLASTIGSEWEFVQSL